MEAAAVVESKLKASLQDASDKYSKIMDRMKKSSIEQMTIASGGRLKAAVAADPVASLSAQLSLAVTEAAGAVSFFTRDHGAVAGSLSLVAVLVTALVNSSKKFLEMEKAASAASERLADLTSMTGTWFLEELCSISSSVAQMTSMLKECSVGGAALLDLDPAATPYLPFVEAGVAGVKAVKNVYLGLQELLTNFKRIILPESLKCFQTEEPTVMKAAEGLGNLLNDCDNWAATDEDGEGSGVDGGSGDKRSPKTLASLKKMRQSTPEPANPADKVSGIDRLIKQMEVQLINVVMGVQINPEAVPIFKIVVELKTKFSALMKNVGLELPADDIVDGGGGGGANSSSSASSSSTSSLTPGQMLLMGFNGLFEKLETDAIAMYKSIQAFADIPANWKKVDLIKEARSLQKTALNHSTVDILQSLFFLRRLKAMREFFDIAVLHSQLIAFPERANVAPPDEAKKKPDASSVFTPAFVKDKWNKTPLVSRRDNTISLR